MPTRTKRYNYKLLIWKRSIFKLLFKCANIFLTILTRHMYRNPHKLYLQLCCYLVYQRADSLTLKAIGPILLLLFHASDTKSYWIFIDQRIELTAKFDSNTPCLLLTLKPCHIWIWFCFLQRPWATNLVNFTKFRMILTPKILCVHLRKELSSSNARAEVSYLSTEQVSLLSGKKLLKWNIKS